MEESIYDLRKYLCKISKGAEEVLILSGKDSFFFCLAKWQESQSDIIFLYIVKRKLFWNSF